MSRRGKFIVFDGADGSGKSTQINQIREWIMSNGIDVVCTREPGGTQIAESIRHIALSHHDEAVHPATEILLMWAARQQHLEHVIKPALKSGAWVLCDRFVASTWAYNICGRQLDRETLYDQLYQEIVADTEPDLALIFDLPGDVSRERSRLRGNEDRLDSESKAFFDRVKRGYDQFVQEHEYAQLIDASGSLHEVEKRLKRSIIELMRPEQDYYPAGPA